MLSLEKMRFATREQLQRLHQLGSDRNALKILVEMKEYLQVKTHEGRNVYYLSAKGREVIGVEDEIKWSLQVDHHLLRNDMYLFYQCPDDWRTEEKVSFKYKNGLTYKETSLVPDATFTAYNTYYFLEVDRTQSMAENKKKIKQYALLSPAIEAQYQTKPVLVFYTTTESRKSVLEKFCKEVGLQHKVYSKEDLR